MIPSVFYGQQRWHFRQQRNGYSQKGMPKSYFIVVNFILQNWKSLQCCTANKQAMKVNVQSEHIKHSKNRIILKCERKTIRKSKPQKKTLGFN